MKLKGKNIIAKDIGAGGKNVLKCPIWPGAPIISRFSRERDVS
jgi:hypothetical protein